MPDENATKMRMFDDLRWGEDDNPTIGIVLCTDREETMVKYSVLKESEQLFASKYRLVLPSEEELEREVEREVSKLLQKKENFPMTKDNPETQQPRGHAPLPKNNPTTNAVGDAIMRPLQNTHPTTNAVGDAIMRPLQKIKNFVIFQTDEGKVNVDVFFAYETLWLTQKVMAELFSVDRTVITKHLQHIFNEQELVEESVSAFFAHTASDGKTYKTRFYSLDAIIAVGYRVNSKRATSFRIWATDLLKEFMLKGFVLDDERLKQGKHWGQDYFEELLERIREIRSSERRFYQKITDLYALSADYDKDAAVTREFFATVRNYSAIDIRDIRGTRESVLNMFEDRDTLLAAG